MVYPFLATTKESEILQKTDHDIFHVPRAHGPSRKDNPRLGGGRADFSVAILNNSFFEIFANNGILKTLSFVCVVAMVRVVEGGPNVLELAVKVHVVRSVIVFGRSQ
jgi:hypothetical protein